MATSLCSSPNTNHHTIISHSSSRSCRQTLRLHFRPNSKDFTPFRLKISRREKKALRRWSRLPMVSCLVEDYSEENPEPIQSSVSKNSQEEAVVDLKLPRRSLLVKFTCDACGVRSQRLINRLAYDRGLVYVQCSGCSQYHKLVDNLGLVVEHNLQE